MIQTHGELAKTILQQGKIVIGGKLEIVKTPEQADTIAQRVINEEVSRRDKIADDNAKETAKASEARSTAVPRVTGRQKAADLAAPQYEVVDGKTPAPKFEVVDAQPAAGGVESKNGPEIRSESAPPAGNVRDKVGGETVRVPRGEGTVPVGHEHSNGALAEVSGTNVAGRVSEPANAGDVSSAGNGAAFAKGDSVTFPNKVQLSKGNGESHIIPAGATGSVNWADQANARVTLSDGRVIDKVPLRHLEKGSNEAQRENAGTGTDRGSTAPDVRPSLGTAGAKAGANENLNSNVAKSSSGTDANSVTPGKVGPRFPDRFGDAAKEKGMRWPTREQVVV
jgi:hypothetical protein